MRKVLFFLVMLMASFNFILSCEAAAVELSAGSTIYVPIYRSFYYGHSSSKEAHSLTCTACFHNTDPKQSIVVYDVAHYDSKGKLIKKLLFAPITINPWSSKEISILPEAQPEDFGSNLIVRWKSEQPANPLLVEVLMVGQVLNRGFSFLTRGQEIKE
jgi:hypothetical protein